MKPRTHLIIPDTQVKPGVPLDHLEWIGRYIVEKKPDVVVHLGDHADMPSLSSYDKGKKDFEGRRVKADIESAKEGMRVLLKPIRDHNSKRRIFKERQYRPEMHITLGNHEERILRLCNSQAELYGFLSMQSLEYEKDWQVHDFLKHVEIDGITYSHYFYNPNTGRPIGGENLMTRLNKLGFSFTQGHQQGYASIPKALNNGRTIRGVVAGSCYLHDEPYLGPQGNNYKRLILMKHEVKAGDYDLMEVSLDKLCRKYEGCHLFEYMQRHHPDLFNQSFWLKSQAEKWAV